MATKKAAEKEKPDMLGTAELAAKLKIDPKKLRLILRKNEVEKEEGRYAWKPDSQFVTKTAPRLVEEYEAAAEKAAKEEKPAKKKAAKKAVKKSAKKSKKEEPESDEPEEL